MKKFILFAAFAWLSNAVVSAQQGAPWFPMTPGIYWHNNGTIMEVAFACNYQNIPTSAETPVEYHFFITKDSIGSGGETVPAVVYSASGPVLTGEHLTGNEPLAPNGGYNILVSSPVLTKDSVYKVFLQVSNDSGAAIYRTTVTSMSGTWLGVKSLSGTRCAVFPTLFSNSLTISSEEDISLTVIDMSGKQIVSQKVLVGNTQIATFEIPNGNYVAYLTSSSGTKVVKISK